MKTLYLVIGLFLLSYTPALAQKDTSKVDELFAKATRYFDKQKIDSSAIVFKESEKICIDQKLWTRYVRCENELGILMQWKNLKDSAYKYFRNAFNKATEVLRPDDPAIGNCCFNICFEFRAKGQMDSALYYCNKAQQLWTKAYGEYDKFVVFAYNKKAFLYMDMARFKEALECFFRIKDINIKLHGPDHSLVAGSYGNIAIVYHAMGDYDKEAEYQNRTLSILYKSDKPDYKKIAATYNNMGILFKDKGDLDKAKQYQEEALKIRLSSLPENHEDIAASYNNLASIHYDKKEFKESLLCEKKALSIRKIALGNEHPLTAKSLENIGLFYYEEGNNQLALNYQEQALQIRIKTLPGNNPELAESYTNIGNIYKKTSDYRTSLIYHQKARNIYTAAFGEESQETALALLNIGSVFEEMQRFDSALYYHNRSLVVYRKVFGPYHPEVAENLRAISAIYLQKMNTDSALNYNNQAIKTLIKNWKTTIPCTSIQPDSIMYKYDMLYILSLRAEILASNKDINEQVAALDIYKYITNLVEIIRNSMFEQDSKLLFTRELPDILAKAIKLCNKLYTSSKNEAYIHEAFSFCEYMKAGVLTEAIVESDAKNFAHLPDSIIRREKSFKIEINLLETKLKELTVSKQTSFGSDSIENKIFGLKEDYKKFSDMLKTSYPKYYELKSRPIIPTTDQISKLLKANEALVEYVYSDSSLFIFSFTNKEVFLKRIQLDTSFKKSLSKYLVALNKIKVADVNSLSPYLYNALIKPVWEVIKSKQVIHIVPDGELWYLPFETLYPLAIQDISDFTKPDYIIRHADISYGISSSLWYRNKIMTDRIAKNPVSFAFMGFAPVFDENYANGKKLSQVFYVDSLGAETAMRGVEENNWKLNPLPFSKNEVMDIQEMFKNKHLPSVTYLYKYASKKNLIDEGKNARILHIASHGIMNTNEPGLTGIFFASDDTTTKAANADKQVLFSGETYNLDLNADLLVLSACETGAGQLMRGEGVISISRGFMYAGVPNIVYSLWKIGDRNTHDLMVEFYKEYLSGKDYSSALRNAKLSLLKKREQAFPKNWAGMVLVGN